MIIFSAMLSFMLHANEPLLAPSYFDIHEAKVRCSTAHTESPELFMNEFSWGYSLEALADKFEEVYNSGNRIGTHATYNKTTDSFQLYLSEFNDFASFKITEEFIKSVTLQIETAHENNFGEFLIFPDMGHSHLYFPEDHWKKVYAGKKLTKAKKYEMMLADPLMRPLYHLTEQLQMVDANGKVLPDPILAFKYWNRNFLGYNNGTKDYDIPVNKTQSYNTVRELPGYHRWSAGFAVSASKDGCFPYRDKQGNKRYFDISLNDPRHDPSDHPTGEF